MLQNSIHGGVVFCGKPWTNLSPTAACNWLRPRSTLFAPRTLTKVDQADRVRAVYLHACLRYVEREFMTNTSLRERLLPSMGATLAPM